MYKLLLLYMLAANVCILAVYSTTVLLFTITIVYTTMIVYYTVVYYTINYSKERGGPLVYYRTTSHSSTQHKVATYKKIYFIMRKVYKYFFKLNLSNY